MEVILNPGTGPVAGASLDNAYANMAQLVRDVTEGFPVTRIALERNPAQDDDGYFGFKIGVFLAEPAIDRALTLEIDMPGLPLERVNYGARPGDNIWHFPRLYVDGSSYVWQYAVPRCRETIAGAAPRRTQVAERTTLLYGYNDGILDEEGLAAAWGGVARIAADGTVELIEDRQDEFGDAESLATLLEKLDTKLQGRWIAQARRLLESGDMSLTQDREFVLVDEAGVRIKANTHGSAGHLYVRAVLS